MTIDLPDETRKRLHRGLQTHFLDHFDLEIGELQCTLLTDFVLGMIGPTVYNLAITDAQAYLQGKVIDMEIDLLETVEYEGKRENGEQDG